MRKLLCMIAIAAISFGSVYAAPFQTKMKAKTDTSKMKMKKKMTKSKMKMKMKKDTGKMKM
jgi:hypothetical protein